MTSRNITVHRQNREIRNAAPIKPEEEVGTQDGKRIRSSGRRSNIVSFMERKRVIPLGIARMQKKLRRESRAGQLHYLRHRSHNLGR